MNNHELDFKKATEALKEVRLSDTAKKTMLANIYKEAALPNEAIPSPFGISMILRQHRYFVALATLVLMMGGTAYASTASLPGDPLYAIKVDVMEPMALALKFNEETKNEYRIALLQERVSEIQELKAGGRLDYDRETISAIIAQENVIEIEASAVFDINNANLEVSGHIETYNALVEEPHRLQTIIEVPRKNKDDERKKGRDKEEEVEKDDADLEIEKPVKEIINDAEKVAEEATKSVKDIEETLEATVDEAPRETKGILNRMIKGIGL